ncbi:MAG: AAA family ATPase [Armatimonadetes bacterium]|nr:AAA family ATPase [Armatimonadota bacterium]
MFTLNDNQRAMLAAARAWQEETERGASHWSRRAEQGAAAEAFGRLLSESGLRAGRPLEAGARARLLRLAAELAPNTNLSRRLYAADAADFDRRLRALLYGDETLEARLRAFLAPRGTGALTASALLSAFAPDTYPLVTHFALRRLKLTAAQRRTALKVAAERYGFAVTPRPDAAQRLLALFVVYESVRDALGASSYPEADDLLRADWALLPTIAAADVVREPPAAYLPSPAPVLTESHLLAAMGEYALGQGFVFPPSLLRSYYIALKTKPFAILSGVSGTGKTKLAELFAEALTGHQPAQFRLIPVRPDWADSTPLLGYQNVLANRYVTAPFLDLAREAARPENRQRAYFVCLDEMNLARVEHYLAEYLSALESRTKRVALHEGAPDFVLSPNFFVTGTVNVDETTHAFSRKVLDRANTLDFDAAPVLLEGLGDGKGPALLSDDLCLSPLQRQSLFLSARVANVGRARERLAQLDPKFPARALSLLQAANDRLYPPRLHFAYRVRDEVLMFLANAFDAETGEGLLRPDPSENFALALDLQVKQKVLPKLNGVAEILDPLLAALRAWAEAENLPQTAAKLARMRDHGAATGYVRFYE